MSSEYSNASTAFSQSSDQEDEIDLRIYWAVLLEGKWLVIAATLIALLCGVFFVWQAKSEYMSDVLLQIENDKAGGVSGLEDISSMLMASSPAVPAEIEIIQSRTILGAVIEKLRLDIHVEPLYFPVFGEALARRFSPEENKKLADPLFGLTDYAWGGEFLHVDSLSVPVEFLDENLQLICKTKSTYVLQDVDGKTLLQGVVGQLATLGEFNLFVSQLLAREGTVFYVLKQSRQEAVVSLKKQLKVTEVQKSTGLLKVVVSGYIPAMAAKIADAVANIYLRQSVERKSEEAKMALLFLQKQLPTVKEKLDVAEQKLNDYRKKRGSINLQLETQSLLAQSVEIEKQLSSLEIEREELRQKFTKNHPLIQSIDSKKQQFTEEKVKLNQNIQTLPETEREVLRFTQDLQVNSELYMFLLNKMQELQVVKAGIVGNVRVIDYAEVAVKSFKPKRQLIVAVFLMVGFLLGIVVVFVRHAMNTAIEDPDIIEQKFGLSVFASIPHSDQQEILSNNLKNTKHKGRNVQHILAKRFPDDLCIEALRSLRTNLHFALLEAKNNVVMLTGPAPNLGKSFVSINFAQVIADSGKSVLIIDGDLRKGHLCDYVGVKRSPGFSDVLAGDVDFSDAVVPLESDNFFLLPNGTCPPNPSELLMRDKCFEVVNEASEKFDVVIIDTPPVLAVTDAAIIGKHVGTTFMLLRSGKHEEREIQQAIDHLKCVDIRLNGVIFNDLYFKGSTYGYGGYRYQYSYKNE